MTLPQHGWGRVRGAMINDFLLLFLELLFQYEEQFNCQIYESWFIEPIETEGTGQEFLIALLRTNLQN